MEVIKTKRGYVKASVTRICTYCSNITAETTTEALQTRLDRLNEAWSEFKSYQNQIYEFAGDSNFEDQEQEEAEFETKYFTAKAILSKAIKDRSVITPPNIDSSSNDIFARLADQQTSFLERFSSTCVAQSCYSNNSIQTKLPKLNIPTFSGNYNEWISFRDLFTDSIHNNPRLTDTQRFQYLKGFLTGDAEALLRHIPVTDKNYAEAWARLKNRYEKTGHIIKSFIQSFLNLPSVTTASAVSLRRLSDGSDEVIRGLHALGDAAETRDPWLIYLLINKTDPDTRQEWAEHIVNIEFPTIEQLLKFIDKRCTTLENSQISNRSSQVTTKSNKPSTVIKTFHSINSNFNTSQSEYNQSITCPLCGRNHLLFSCSEFKSLGIISRRAFVNEKKLCFNCLRSGHTSSNCKSRHTCNQCNRRHHTLVHLLSNTQPSSNSQLNTTVTSSTSPNVTSNPIRSSSSTNQSNVNPHNQSIINTHSTSRLLQTHSLLPTATAHVIDTNGNKIDCRILLDSGSQVSFITDSFVQKLGLKRNHARIPVTGLSSIGAGITKGVVSLVLHSRYTSQSIAIDAYILNKITSLIPNSTVELPSIDMLSTLQLADPSFNLPASVDILIGAHKMFEILQEGFIQGSKDTPSAQRTLFGWIIVGEVINNCTKINSLQGSLVSLVSNMDIDRSLQTFWELENVDFYQSTHSPEEQIAEQHFCKTHSRTEQGRYIVELPFKHSSIDLGNSYFVALNRLKSMERRFAHDIKFKEKYHSFINEYIHLGHMEKIPSNEIECKQAFYLPHHAVCKPDSSTTKLRVVFDGSAKSSNGTSLNDALLVGPSIQRDLFSVCLRFRRHKYVFTADIEKMYRQILVSKVHCDFQRILWRESPSQQIEHYRLLTVTYGISSAPFLAIRTLKQLAIDSEKQYPDASKVIRDDFYVDDVMTGAASVNELMHLKNDLVHVLHSAGFTLRKFCSNCWPLLKSVPESDCELSEIEIVNDSRSIKTLGLHWHPSLDAFSYKITQPIDNAITKRRILSEASKIFDPLGFLTPAIVMIKILFQQLWLLDLKWDDPVPNNISKQWCLIRNEFKHLEQLRIPRNLCLQTTRYQLHGFSDASQSAYSAAVYCRTVNADNNINIHLIAAKSKVAPLKQISIPKLELCGALLLTRLLQKICKTLELTPGNIFAWTDSQIVLHWLSSIPRRWNTFVANRTSSILDIIPRSQWRYVESKDNPADCASRGILSSDLITHELWWKGPQWLILDESIWPCSSPSIDSQIDIPDERKVSSVLTLTATTPSHIFDDLLLKISSWKKLIRIIAYCFRFSNRCLHKFQNIYTQSLQHDEISNAKVALIVYAQQQEFKQEYTALSNAKLLSSRSKLVKLTPFIDEKGVLRVGGRIIHSSLSYSSKHPIILPKGHRVTRLIIEDAHLTHLHAGISTLFSILRQEYWIIGCRNMLRKIVHDCITCFKQRRSINNQIMGNLPAHRVTYSRPFLNVGCDYAGPFSLRTHRGRNPRYTKGYLVLFICFSTKAFHLELASDLTTDAFIAALKRFFARRGKCQRIFSDNGTNFKGAHRMLSELDSLMNSSSHNNAVQNYLSINGIQWSFIPPGAPHFGGLWEAGVKNVKSHLKRVIGNQILTFEEMYTVLTQIEALLNSKPLCSASDLDIDVLTPAHFLIGHSYVTLPEIDYTKTSPSRLTNWQLLQNMVQGFWKRWHNDYLTSLQQRPKWLLPQPDIKPDALVLLKEPNTPPSKWHLARVIEVHPGQDDHVRVVTVRSTKGTFRRPITKIVPLPTS